MKQQVPIGFDPKDKSLIKEAAAAKGMSFSAYVRSAAIVAARGDVKEITHAESVVKAVRGE